MKFILCMIVALLLTCILAARFASLGATIFFAGPLAITGSFVMFLVLLFISLRIVHGK